MTPSLHLCRGTEQGRKRARKEGREKEGREKGARERGREKGREEGKEGGSDTYQVIITRDSPPTVSLNSTIPLRVRESARAMVQ